MKTPTGGDKQWQEEDRLYIQDSSDEELPEGGRTLYCAKRTKRKAHAAVRSRPQPQIRHIIKQETTPSLNAERPFNSVRHLLDPTPESRKEGIDDSDSEGERCPTQGDRTPHEKPLLPRPWETAGKHTTGKNRGELIGTDVIEDEDFDGDGAKGLSQSPTAQKQSRVPNGFLKSPAEAAETGSAMEVSTASGQRSFLASHLPALAHTRVPSSARRATPKKGMGPLCSQLQQALKEQEKAVRLKHDVEVKVLTYKIEGPMLRAYCQLSHCADASVTLPKNLVVLLKTEDRLQASPGDMIFISKPWQLLNVDGVQTLLVRHATSNHRAV